MKLFKAFAILVTLVGRDAAAAQCDTASENVARTSIGTAVTASKKAFSALPSSAGVNPGYDKAFGAFSASRNDVVKRTLSQIIASLTIGDIKLQCETQTEATCGSDRNPWAWVEPGTAFTIHICPAFFDGGEDERPGLIVHEMSHFVTNGATDDYCKTEDDCTALAKSEPDKAVRSAASYQLYIYDYR
ncbi:M35 family metallo-endopeptidase [Rhizobium leguminosarum]